MVKATPRRAQLSSPPPLRTLQRTDRAAAIHQQKFYSVRCRVAGHRERKSGEEQ